MSAPFIFSYALLWIVVILLSIALFILYSHVGKRLLSSHEGHAMQGPELEKRIQPQVLSAVTGSPVTIGGASPRPRLVIYSSAKCEPCRDLLRGLPEAVGHFGDRVDTFLICSGKVAEVRAFAADVPNQVTVCVDEEDEVADSYRILRTPYALSVDREGVLRYKGVPGPDFKTLSHFFEPLVRDAQPGRNTRKMAV
ncbi:MAG TPA: redoxin domain-containing protein [Gemmatimonadaceae bacterium]|nr:redoxin domain-containing protein [Gemmatimonadaceae bacterium]